MHSQKVKDFLIELQNEICFALGDNQGEIVIKDDWKKSDANRLSGNGSTRIIEKGKVFERGGVNFSDVSGSSLPSSATLVRPELKGMSFRAMGISLVFHPSGLSSKFAFLSKRLYRNNLSCRMHTHLNHYTLKYICHLSFQDPD